MGLDGCLGSIALHAERCLLATQDNAVGEARHDEFATYSNSTYDDAQTGWMAFG